MPTGAAADFVIICGCCKVELPNALASLISCIDYVYSFDGGSSSFKSLAPAAVQKMF